MTFDASNVYSQLTKRCLLYTSGIYIGGGSFVHAAGNGSGTVGQYPNQCVKTASLSGYWENHAYNYRRLY